jgi:superfamily II DNA or RNA helicase
MTLRDYQSECKAKIKTAWQEFKSALAVLFTGAGKTIIFASVAADVVESGKRVMVIAGRRELIRQAKNKIERSTGIHCGVEMGVEEVAEHEQLFGEQPQIIIATIQTLISDFGGRSRMSKFDPKDFGALILDEVHNCVSDSYLNAINYFKQNPLLKILGVTATPDRLDEKALGQVCETVAYEADILFGIENGWLVPIEQQQVRVKGLDFSEIKTVQGDLDSAELAAILEEEEKLHGMVHPALEVIFGLAPRTLTDIPIEQWTATLANCRPRRTLIFTHSVRQAELTAEILNRHVGGLCGWIHGGTRIKSALIY